MDHPAYQHVDLGSVRLDQGLFEDRHRLGRDYLLSLEVDNLLQNHRIEAGLAGRSTILRGDGPVGDDRHWGWESPGSPMRGHFVGHWLSAAAREVAVTGDPVLAARVRAVVDGIAACQESNGGEWAFAVSPRLFDHLAQGRPVWAPQYVAHKTLMGLVDAARELGDRQALDVAVRAAAWFDRWTAALEPERLAAVLEVETGGMLEVWADLLDLTGDDRFRVLLDRYWHAPLFDTLLAGGDPLTNRHANTTIPEVLGAARAYEVTGDDRWRAVVEAYWRCAVTDRGTFCTGGQTSGEIWTPPFELAARRGEKNQEHCTVYNMTRLADVLFRWSGDVAYLDFVELNAYNGLLAQQHPRTGMVAYFLPLAGGARKAWGSPTEHFWCCHGTLAQAHTRHAEGVFYLGGFYLGGPSADTSASVVVAQYRPATLRTDLDGAPLTVVLELGEHVHAPGFDANDAAAGSRHRPAGWEALVTVDAAGREVALRLRVPEWTAGEVQVTVDGVEQATAVVDGFVTLVRAWCGEQVRLWLPSAVRAVPIPDEPTTVAFVDGPVVLAAECEHEPVLALEGRAPADLLRPDDERHWGEWRRTWRVAGQSRTLRLRPLHEVADEPYSVYFPTHD